MLARFFAPDAGLAARPGAGRSAVATTLELPEDESAHATRVLRLAVGDGIRVFNGTGDEWRAEITGIARHRVTVSLREAIQPAPEARIPIVLVLALLKGDKMDDVVRDAVMLGVADIQPLVTDRTEIDPAAVARSNRVVRWQRIAVSSCKQCGRAVVPGVNQTKTFESYIAEPSRHLRLMLVEPGAAAHVPDVHDVAAPEAAEVMVGPEGGWSSRELRLAEEADVRRVTLGALTLRADAVPLVALTALRTVWRDL